VVFEREYFDYSNFGPRYEGWDSMTRLRSELKVEHNCKHRHTDSELYTIFRLAQAVDSGKTDPKAVSQLLIKRPKMGEERRIHRFPSLLAALKLAERAMTERGVN